MTLEQAKRQSERVTGVSNVTYDLVTVLQNKLQGVAAMEEYKADAQESGDQEVMRLLEGMEQREHEDIQRLKSMLSQRLS